MSEELFVKVDSHAHITSDELFEHADEIIERALKNRVEKIVNICTDQRTLERGIILAKKYPEIIFNTASTTPHDVEKEGESFFPLVEQAVKDDLLVAVGETGLDYYYEHSKRDLQKSYLIKYFELAKEHSLNVVIHCRGDEAFADLFEIAAAQERSPKCLLHCFTGNLDQAKEALSRGWMISLSGIVTFKRSTDLRDVIKEIPLESLLIETDSPYLAPQSKRGKTNEPSYIGEIAETVASVKEISLEEVCQQTVKNTLGFFQLSRNIQTT